MEIRSSVWLGGVKQIEVEVDDDDAITEEEEDFLSDDDNDIDREEGGDGVADKLYMQAEREEELKFEQAEKRQEQLADKRDYGQRQRSGGFPPLVKNFRRSSLIQLHSLSRGASGGSEGEVTGAEVGDCRRKLSIRAEAAHSKSDLKLKRGVVSSLPGFVDVSVVQANIF